MINQELVRHGTGKLASMPRVSSCGGEKGRCGLWREVMPQDVDKCRRKRGCG